MPLIDLDSRETEVEFVRKAVERTAWDYVYNERELPKAHLVLAHLKVIISRCFREMNIDEIDRDRDYDEESPPKNAAEYIEMLISETLTTVEYHVRALGQARVALAGAENMLKHCGYPEIDLDQIMKEQREKGRR